MSTARLGGPVGPFILLVITLAACSSSISVRERRANAEYATFSNDIEVLIRMGSASFFLPGDRADVIIINHSRRPLVLDFATDEYYYHVGDERTQAHVMGLGSSYPRFVRYKEAVQVGLLTHKKSLSITLFEFRWRAGGLTLNVPLVTREPGMAASEAQDGA